MKSKIIRDIGLFAIATIFSVGLMFAFTEIPQIIDHFIQSKIPTPHFDPINNTNRVEIFYNAYAIRLIGYICLGLIASSIIIGFTTRKSGLALLGSIGLFLPVFATFAHSMFYLAGLGLLNVVFFPFMDLSTLIFDLGKVVMIPYWVMIWFLELFGWNAHRFLIYFFMILGAFIFVQGVFAWFQTRYQNLKTAKNWIYKFSRHPQYLGWIIWSYGLMLYGPSLEHMKKSWGWYSTLPWLLSTMVIIGISLLEEIKMKKVVGNEYTEYRNKTPFFFPMPKVLWRILTIPIRILLNKNCLEKKREVGIMVLVYTIVFMGLSLFWVDFGQHKDDFEEQAFDHARVELILNEIKQPQSRRYRNLKPFDELLSMGSKSHPYLIQLINDPDIDVKDLSIQAASKYKITDAIPDLLKSLDHPSGSVVESAAIALGDLQVQAAKEPLFELLEHPKPGVKQVILISVLSKLGCSKIIPLLHEQLKSEKWYQVVGALRAMMQLDTAMAKPYVYKALEDKRLNVRKEMVNLILEYLPSDAVPHLQKVTNDEQWEVSFYAQQAIQLIQNK